MSLFCLQDRNGTDESKEIITRPFIRSPQKDTLVYTEAQKMVEFEADGRCHKFSIYDALSLISKVLKIFFIIIFLSKFEFKINLDKHAFRLTFKKKRSNLIT